MKSSKEITKKKLPPEKAPKRKCPNPTNFSNSRSQIYLSYNHSELDKRINMKNADVDSKMEYNSSIEEIKEAKIKFQKSKEMLPQSSKVMMNLKQFFTDRRTEKTEFGPMRVQRTEKLEPKLLPIGNDSLIDTTKVSTERENSRKIKTKEISSNNKRIMLEIQKPPMDSKLKKTPIKNMNDKSRNRSRSEHPKELNKENAKVCIENKIGHH